MFFLNVTTTSLSESDLTGLPAPFSHVVGFKPFFFLIFLLLLIGTTVVKREERDADKITH